jgi:hypothetical protein
MFKEQLNEVQQKIVEAKATLDELETELKEKESTGGSIEETDNQNNILEVEKDNPSNNEEYIKGGSTKKIRIELK